jgi:hypothetical protein
MRDDLPAAAAEGHDWLDHEAGPVVRPYAVTGGRARSTSGHLDLLAYVETVHRPAADLVELQPEHRSILVMARTALSVAEVAARLDLPLGVVRVLIGDLLHIGLVEIVGTDPSRHTPTEDLLKAVIDGLRAL